MCVCVLVSVLTLFDHVDIAIVQSVISFVSVASCHDLLYDNGGIDSSVPSDGGTGSSQGFANYLHSLSLIS